MTRMKPGFLFDLNGTMINDMDYHIQAWHRILNELGADISMERMKEECYGKNHELIERTFPGRFSMEEKDSMSEAKEEEYRRLFKPHLKLIPGLKLFLARAHEMGIAMAIGTAAVMSNIDFVLDNLQIRKYFDALISADDVHVSKPDPETFLTCSARLSIPPKDCIVFEDGPKGVESAMNAGMDAIAITIQYEASDFRAFPNVIRCIKDFQRIRPKDLIKP